MRRGRRRRARALPRPSRARRRRGRARRSRRLCGGARGSAAPSRRPVRRSACQRPATRTKGSFAAARSASSCSLRTVSPTASFQSNVASEAVERRPLERAGRPLLVAVRLTRSLLGDPSQVPGSSTGTPRASSSGIASRRNSCTSSPSSSASAGVASVEADAVLGEQRLDLGQLAGQVAVRVARAQEREDLVALLVQQPGGQPEGRIVLGVQPQLEHQRRPALVQVEAELPRRRGAAAEAVVEPAGEPAVERRVARVARQLRVGRAEPVEEELDARSGGRSAARRRAGPVRPEGGRARSGRRGRGRDRARSRRGRRRTPRRRLPGAQRRSGRAPPARSRRAWRPRTRARSRRRARGRGGRGPR